MKLTLRGILAAAALVTGLSLHADTTVVITGGNASKGVLFDRTEALLGSGNFTKVNNPNNSSVRTYIAKAALGGTNAGLGKITIHFVLNGAALGLSDVLAQNKVTTANNLQLVAPVAVSSVQPDTVGIDSTLFTVKPTAVVPFVFIKSPATPNSIAGVTNLTQRQAYYLEQSSGLVPTAFFGGSSTTDYLYLVGRDTGAAVRQVIDASIYFSGTPSFWITNTPASDPPINDPAGGRPTGGDVTNNVALIPNSIGTVSAGDIGGFQTLSYEGVPFSTANVVNGSYPIWGYESWYLKQGTGAPSGNVLTVLNLLFALVTDDTYQHSNSNFVGKFVPLNDLQVTRSVDGGPITSTIY
jgi:hypothetical protein